MESTLAIRPPIFTVFPSALILSAIAAPPERPPRIEPPGGHPPAIEWSDGTIGAEACSRCHAEQYADWLTTPHARAFESLGPAEREDPACVGCHSTSARPAGHGVQCESCHGPGADYYPDFVMRDSQLAKALGLRAGGDEATCRRCHTPDTPSIEPFVYERAILKVSHRPRGPSS